MNQPSPLFLLGAITAYFLLLVIVSWFTSRTTADNKDFFLASRQSSWYLVAFGMIGGSLSGVTFISVPGWVGSSQFSYMQMVLGYLLGYLIIATVLMPMYYRLQLTSIYSYLEQRFGNSSYKTGAAFFLLSRTIGSSVRLYLAAIVLQEFVLAHFGIPFWLTVAILIVLIWVYTHKGGIKTIIITDILQTICLLLVLVLTIFAIGSKMNLSVGELLETVRHSDYSQIFFFDGGWGDSKNFFKQFLAGASIAIVMTGLDQDMMQKNLSCKSIGDAQKNMFWYSLVLVFVNLLFLGLGALLFIYATQIGVEIPTRIVGTEVKEATDLLYPTIALQHMSPAIGVAFIIGLIAAAYSGADSALTALTTSFCIDFLGFEKKENMEEENRKTRLLVHIGFSVLTFFVVLLFWFINDAAVIQQIFTIAGYTYGPLLGLYAFGFFLKRPIVDRFTPLICIASPIITFFLNKYSAQLFFGYKFSFELLILNGLITFLGLLAISYTEEPSGGNS